MNSVVKYRYIRQGTLPTQEDDSADRPVRYRLYAVSGPGAVDDVVSSWSDGPFSGPVGRISGHVTDRTTAAGLTNILVAAGGQQTLTDSNGSFVLEGLPPGTHNLVAYALDGAFQTYQQGARVEAGKRTPVDLSLAPAALMDVLFTVVVPRDTIRSVPIRMAGNLYQLGNTFGDLDGGVNGVATRMPMLSPMPDGRYTLSLKLPAGADIRYKYTLGDGFWNAEHAADGAFVLRELIVPAAPNPVQVQDVIDTWKAGSSASILFETSVPANTPVSDIVSIQMTSAPPATSAMACSAKPATASTNCISPTGSRIPPLGPMSPATRARPPASLAASRAISTAARFSSGTFACRLCIPSRKRLPPKVFVRMICEPASR
jgi:hypothetical protein